VVAQVGQETLALGGSQHAAACREPTSAGPAFGGHRDCFPTARPADRSALRRAMARFSSTRSDGSPRAARRAALGPILFCGSSAIPRSAWERWSIRAAWPCATVLQGSGVWAQ